MSGNLCFKTEYMETYNISRKIQNLSILFDWTERDESIRWDWVFVKHHLDSKYKPL